MPTPEDYSKDHSEFHRREFELGNASVQRANDHRLGGLPQQYGQSRMKAMCARWYRLMLSTFGLAW